MYSLLRSFKIVFFFFFLYIYVYIFALAVERILQIKRENKSVLTVDGSIFSDEKNLKVIEYL